jgi:NADPH-dependent curcumin reductase CurA
LPCAIGNIPSPKSKHENHENNQSKKPLVCSTDRLAIPGQIVNPEYSEYIIQKIRKMPNLLLCRCQCYHGCHAACTQANAK